MRVFRPLLNYLLLWLLQVNPQLVHNIMHHPRVGSAVPTHYLEQLVLLDGNQKYLPLYLHAQTGGYVFNELVKLCLLVLSARHLDHEVGDFLCEAFGDANVGHSVVADVHLLPELLIFLVHLGHERGDKPEDVCHHDNCDNHLNASEGQLGSGRGQHVRD